VFVAQLAERSLQHLPKDPAISNFYNEHLFTAKCIGKTKKRHAWNGLLVKKHLVLDYEVDVTW